MTGRALVVRGDARSLPLPDASVDLIVTSPPYFALRSYTDGGDHYAGQIGSEATPREFLDALWTCTAEWVRVLKPEGSMFVNLGDKYSGAQAQNTTARAGDDSARKTDPKRTGIPNKSLMLLPERYRIGCVDRLGLTARAVIVWDKPNGLPESVTDRVRRSHEDWVHLVKQPRYYSAVDEIREAFADARPFTPKPTQADVPNRGRNAAMTGKNLGVLGNPLGKLPGSVWTIPTEPLRVPEHLGIDHFAAFPSAWPKRIIAGWSPPGICVECGQGRRPVTVHLGYTVEGGLNNGTDPVVTTHGKGRATLGMVGRRDITGYACACAEPTAPTRPAIIVDPFGGTGTTALVARALGRVGISVDLSHDYSRLAQWRTSDPGQLAKVLGVEKPPTQIEGQLGMFEEEAS